VFESRNVHEGAIDEWLDPIRDTAKMYQKQLAKIKDPIERDHRLIQLNVIRQIDRLAENPSVTDAWKRGQRLDLSGWVYDITTGQIEDLGVTKHKA
jgi:carbonic anhydrase